MKKVMIIFGTRPEAIKLVPVINEFKTLASKFRISICVTGQHRNMLDQVLRLFKITPDYDLNIMSENQDLFDITVNILDKMKIILNNERPDAVIVQGDTTTSFVASLASYYMRIPVAHIEAGLRTYNKYNPFPEEKNRHLTGVLADFHFASTEWAKNNLIKENVSEERIWVTGNTVIDTLLTVVNSQKSAVKQKEMYGFFKKKWQLIVPFVHENGTDYNINRDVKKLILVTGHRRESFGEGFRNICYALKRIAEKNPNVLIVYPVHLNPNIRRTVYEILGNEQTNAGEERSERIQKNIFLIDPLEYESFIFLMAKSYLILTDSGGIQEEAPSLGKPVLVMRETTERPEGIEAGTVRLVGTTIERIVSESQKLLDNSQQYEAMTRVSNPYGDGKAAERIVQILDGEL